MREKSSGDGESRKTRPRSESDGPRSDTDESVEVRDPGEGLIAELLAPHAFIPRGTGGGEQSGLANIDAAGGGTRGALDPALSAAAERIPIGGNDAEARFEVSMQERFGVAVEMRAMRLALPAAGEQKPGWQLSIASPSVDAAVLARYVPRLNERLQTRGAVHSHIRIEEQSEYEREGER